MERIFTVDEVAEHLNLTARTVYDYIRSGKLNAVKLGRVWRVKESDLQMFLDSLDPASDFIRAVDQEARELLGEEKAAELRERVDKRLSDKGLDPIKWD